MIGFVNLVKALEKMVKNCVVIYVNAEEVQWFILSIKIFQITIQKITQLKFSKFLSLINSITINLLINNQMVKQIIKNYYYK